MDVWHAEIYVYNFIIIIIIVRHLRIIQVKFCITPVYVHMFGRNQSGHCVCVSQLELFFFFVVYEV